MQLFTGIPYLLMLKFKDFQGASSCIFKDQFSMEVYSMHCIQQYLMFISVMTVQLLRNKIVAHL